MTPKQQRMRKLKKEGKTDDYIASWSKGWDALTVRTDDGKADVVKRKAKRKSSRDKA